MRKFAIAVVMVMSSVLLVPTTTLAQDAEPQRDNDGNVVDEQPAALRAAASVPERTAYVPASATLEDTPTILIDGSKGFMFGLRPNTYLANFIELMNDQGYSVVITADGVVEEDMSQYDVFMALTVFTRHEYTTAEFDALDQFMAQGGSLYIAGEAAGCLTCPRGNRNVSAISDRYGDIRVGLNTLRELDYFTSNLTAHPVMTGVDEIYYRYGGAVQASGSATVVAFSENGRDEIVAVNDNIVAVGDNSFLGNDSGSKWWDRADNTAFIINSFSYLIDRDEPVLTCGSLEVTVRGAGTIVGTSGDDVILGSDGPDIIRGGGGNDVICSGDGDDDVRGGSGSDTIFAGDGNDRVNGEGDDDRIFGGPGNDVLLGNAANDTLGGGPGADRLIGGPGDDSLGGGADADVCRGSAGSDRYFQCETKIV